MEEHREVPSGEAGAAVGAANSNQSAKTKSRVSIVAGQDPALAAEAKRSRDAAEVR